MPLLRTDAVPDPLLAYRDDGPVIEAIAPAAVALRIPAGLALPLGVLVLFAGLAIDGRATGTPTLVGFVVFLVLAAGGAVRPPGRRIHWLTPPLVRAAEYGFVAWIGWRAVTASLPVIYGLLSAVAFHHYDVVYRLRHQKIAPPAWVRRAGLGWDGRMIVVLSAALLTYTELTAAVLAVWCAVIFVGESITSWVQVARDTQRTVAVSPEDDEE